jgi:drug/metabolite transporter (DMT)-like permease
MTIILTSYGQIIIKWRSIHYPEFSNNIAVKFYQITKVIITDPFVLSGMLAAYGAAVFWMSAIKYLQLNIAYPLMSLSFVLVFIFSTLLFNEKISGVQIIGLTFICIGVTLIGGSAKVTI